MIPKNATALFLGFALKLLFLGEVLAQVPIGSWRDHFPYHRCISVARSDQKVYGATENAIVAYNPSDNSIERLSKINALSGIGINKIRYNRELGLLVVGYRDGRVDLVSSDRSWTIKDIQASSLLASKSINGISFKGNEAYLSCGFGIAVLDLIDKEVQDSYMIGDNSTAVQVNGISFFRDSLFAATQEGLYKADLGSSNLSDFQNWEKTNPGGFAGPFEEIVRFDQRLFIVHKPDPTPLQDKIFQYENGSWQAFSFDPQAKDVLDIERSGGRLLLSLNGYVQAYDRSDSLVKILHSHPWIGNPFPFEALLWKDRFWVADREHGLLNMRNSWEGLRIQPNGPETKNTFVMESLEDRFWVATGSVENNWDPRYRNDGVLTFHENEWDSYNRLDQAAFDTLYDPISVAIDPEDPDHIFVGTWGSGLIEMEGGTVETVYKDNNSSLNEHTSTSGVFPAWGCDFDDEGNLWVSNSYTNSPISVLTKDGNWHSLNFGGLFSASQRFGPIMCTSFGQKWLILPETGILVFKTGGTPGDESDDRFKLLNSVEGSGGLPSDDPSTIAEDKDKEIWVGTNEGIGVFYTPDDLFSSNPSDAEEVLVEYDGFLEPLLENEDVTSITVNGADEKWIGTANSGVFHVSSDGKEELHRFSEENSPLINNSVKDIAIHPNTGEVFFGTESGILSFRGEATEGVEKLEDVVIYPNPVRKDHNGPIAIRGLPANSTVHITDINGDVVHKTLSKGGQATWDGTDSEGIRVRTGVYLVFVASPDGKQSQAGKLMFYH